MSNPLLNLTVKQLKRAAALKQRIEELEKDLTTILGVPEALTLGGTVRRHRKFSAAARARLSAAAKARWAKFRAGKK